MTMTIDEAIEELEALMDRQPRPSATPQEQLHWKCQVLQAQCFLEAATNSLISNQSESENAA